MQPALLCVRVDSLLLADWVRAMETSHAQLSSPTAAAAYDQRVALFVVCVLVVSAHMIIGRKLSIKCALTSNVCSDPLTFNQSLFDQCLCLSFSRSLQL